MNVKILLRVLLSTFVSISNFYTPLYAVEAFSGIEFQVIEISGVKYEIPVGNIERKNDIFYLKKAIKGDKEALEIFLGGKESRYFFIGQDSPLWLIVNSNGTFKVKHGV